MITVTVTADPLAMTIGDTAVDPDLGCIRSLLGNADLRLYYHRHRRITDWQTVSDGTWTAQAEHINVTALAEALAATFTAAQLDEITDGINRASTQHNCTHAWLPLLGAVEAAQQTSTLHRPAPVDDLVGDGHLIRSNTEAATR